MAIVTESAEHQFLTFLDKIKINPSGWIACHFSFSQKLDHDRLVSSKSCILTLLNKFEKESLDFAQTIEKNASQLPDYKMFKFQDNDLVLLCCPKTEQERCDVSNTLEALTRMLPAELSEYGFLAKELYEYQKIADAKFLSAKKISVYKSLGNTSVVESLAIRRKKRAEPIILVVEDDRFTASYITGFLRDFDVVVARTGEDAVIKYIEYAPDAVFMDIHLPGINGHEALKAIKSADSEAFVVMLSVDTARESIMKASSQGAISYLKKPFSRERVLNTLRLSPFIKHSKGVLPVQC